MKAILRKVILTLVVVSMLAVSAGVVVVAAAMALFGILRGALGGPGAAATVAAAAALLMGVLALVLERWILDRGHGRGRPAPPEDETLLRKLIILAQGRPIVATGALIGAVLMAIRNPALTALVMKAFLDPKSRPSNKKA